jgi:hypothetical protein
MDLEYRLIPLSPFVTKFANYRSLSAMIDNSFPQENKNTPVDE